MMMKTKDTINLSFLFKPLSDKVRIEYYNLQDWKKLYGMTAENRSSELLECREPFKEMLRTSNIVYVWIFSLKDKKPIPISISYKLDYFKKNKDIIKALAAVFVKLSGKYDSEVSTKYIYSEVSKFLKDIKLETTQLEDDFFEGEEKFKFGWITSPNLKYACGILYNINSENNTLISLDEQAELNNRNNIVVARIFDYFQLHNSLTNNIPWMIVYDEVKANPLRAIEFYYETREFNPIKKTNLNFKWPWQRSIIYSEDLKELQYQSIETVSLVGDITNSTFAMSEFKPAEQYANFLNEIISEAKKICLDNGGYFDKETGDGFVVHFCGDQKGNTTSDDAIYSSKQAVDVSKYLIHMTKKVVSKYQRSLMIELDGVGLSIGIHVTDSTWVCSEGQIRALGTSVVRASRLCSAASTNEVIVSPPIYYACIGKKMKMSPSHFTRRLVDLKEIPEVLLPHAYSLKT